MAIKKNSDTKKENPEKSLTVEFLLTEYNELGEFWKHTDARIETGINIYLTVCGFAFPGLGLLYQAIQSIQLFVLASIPVAMAIFILGFVLVQRITSADFNKSEYKLGMQIIRRYFADKDPEITPYLYMPIALSVESHHEIKKHWSPYFHKNLAFAINSFNSLLAGAVFGCLTWLVFNNSLATISIVLMSFGFSFITFSILNWLYRRKINHLTK